MKRQLWEILVPANWNDGEKIDDEYHRSWDARVRAISEGLSIMRTVKGKWEFHGEVFDERVIPCRVLATPEEMEKVIAITLQHYYDQHCVFAYRLSTEIITRYRDVKKV